MTDDGSTLAITLEPEDVAALDAWIRRSDDPGQSRAHAAREIIAGALGSRSPCTVVPHFTTGRDIV